MALNILDHVVLAYEPVWGRSLALTGVRLHVRVRDPASVDVGRLWRLLAQERSDRAPFLLVSLADPESVRQVLAEPPAEGLWLELADDQDFQDECRAAVPHALAAGHRLVERVRPGREAPVPVHPGILQLVELSDLSPPGAVLAPGQLLRHADGAERALSCPASCDAAGVVGWPSTRATVAGSGQAMAADRASVERVLQAVDQDASLEAVEGLILQDVVLAHRAWQLMRSDLFGPDRQPDTVRQALMLMGQGRLRQWLQAQQADATDDPGQRPLRQSLVLRAHLMVQVLEPGAETALASDIHLTGLFSRLDEVLCQPMDQVLGSLPLPEPVTQALQEGEGPYHPTLDVARALEQVEAIDQLTALYQSHDMRLDEVNRALIRMLRDQRVQT
jgi:c-di-GMP phosphodiesterase